jgi:hypothetical protein
MTKHIEVPPGIVKMIKSDNPICTISNSTREYNDFVADLFRLDYTPHTIQVNGQLFSVGDEVRWMNKMWPTYIIESFEWQTDYNHWMFYHGKNKYNPEMCVRISPSTKPLEEAKWYKPMHPKCKNCDSRYMAGMFSGLCLKCETKPPKPDPLEEKFMKEMHEADLRAFAKAWTPPIDFSERKITRVEVIELGVKMHWGREDLKDVWVDYQDDGRTLKIFIKP